MAFLQGFSTYSADVLKNVLDVMEPVVFGGQELCLPVQLRLLAVALKLRARAKAIEREFRNFSIRDGTLYCNNGWTDMEKMGTVQRSCRLVCLCIKLAESSKCLKGSVLTMGLLKTAVKDYLGLTSDDELKKMDCITLKTRLLSFDTSC